jgi:hypothetical protein
MKWSDSIPFNRPLRDVRLLLLAPRQDWQEHLRDREQAAYERGRRDGEHALSGQLLQQRNETVELQRGILDSLRRVVPQVVQEGETALINLALETAKKMSPACRWMRRWWKPSCARRCNRSKTPPKSSSSLHPDDLALLRQHQRPCSGLPETGPLRFTGSPK